MAIIPAAVVVAGGSGSRLGGALPKQFQKLDRQPVLVHCLRLFLDYHADMRVAVPLPARHWRHWVDLCLPHFTEEDSVRLLPVAGGEFRVQSVAAGLLALDLLFALRSGEFQPGVVAVHDGVRPLAGADLLSRVYAEAENSGAAVACVPVKSSLRRLSDNGSQAVDRSQYFEVQTPQAFDFRTLKQAYDQRPHDRFTDDASLLEAVFPQSPVALIEGHYDNLKITTRDDLEVARKLIRRAEKP